MLLPAVCPHCHDAELQVPAELRGTDVICRRCGKTFLFQPAGRSAFDSDPPPRKKKSAGATATATPPAPAAPAPIPAPAPTVTTPAAPDESPDYALWFALAGAGLFGPAMIATQFPYGRIVATVLLLLGLLSAAVGLLGLEVKRWAGWLGLGANAVGLIFVVLLPGWLGISTWVPQKIETSEFKVPTAISRDGLARPVSWVEAGTAVWEMGDVRVAVAAAGVEPPPKPKAGPLAPPVADPTPTLRLTVRLTNMGIARTIEFPGWYAPPVAPPPPGGPPPQVPKLTADGKSVPAKPGPPEPAHPIHPGKSLETVLPFAVPADRGELRLELPAEPFGGTEPVRFQIPWSMVARQNLVPAKPTNP